LLSLEAGELVYGFPGNKPSSCIIFILRGEKVTLKRITSSLEILKKLFDNRADFFHRDLPLTSWPLAEHVSFGQNWSSVFIGPVSFAFIDKACRCSLHFFKSSFLPFHHLLGFYQLSIASLSFDSKVDSYATLLIENVVC